MMLAVLMGVIKDQIEKVELPDKVTEDDRFQVDIAVRTERRGSRACLLTCSLPRRVRGKTRRCRDWEATVTIETYYVDLPTESGGTSVLQRAIDDSERMIDALETWALDNSDVVFEFVPEQGQVSLDGDSELVASRSVQLIYRHGE